MATSFCSPGLNRRRFLSGCACACAGCAATVISPRWLRGSTSSSQRPKVRLVFCETSNAQPIWPNIGYDFDARRGQLINQLQENCSDVEFVVAKSMDQPQHSAEILKGDAEVDGYIVCLQGLGWQNDVFQLCTTGKPTLVVDNLFGGSGLFLTQLPRIMGAGKPVDWVSSSNDQDIVAAARHFGMLQQGKSAAEVAAAFEQTRRSRTPKDGDIVCKEDPVEMRDFAEVLDQLRHMKIVVVGGGWGGEAFINATRDLLGLTFVSVGFEEIAAAYAEADPASAQECAAQWIQAAQEVVEPPRDEIERSAAMYLAMKALMKKHGAMGVSINCLGGFYGGHMKAYPCLGFSQMNNDGLVGGCEADQMSALTMATIGAMTGRPGYISDPVIDTSRNEIIYAHCVAMSKPFGPDGASNPFRIRSHSEDRKGASVQSLLPPGYMTTTLEINPTSKQVLFHQAKSAGNNYSDMACRTKLEAVVEGDIERLTENWRMGWHRVTFYGDLKPHVTELCDRLKLQLIEEA
jgi:hypothetical protein